MSAWALSRNAGDYIPELVDLTNAISEKKYMPLQTPVSKAEKDSKKKGAPAPPSPTEARFGMLPTLLQNLGSSVLDPVAESLTILMESMPHLNNLAASNRQDLWNATETAGRDLSAL